MWGIGAVGCVYVCVEGHWGVKEHAWLVPSCESTRDKKAGRYGEGHRGGAH